MWAKTIYMKNNCILSCLFLSNHPLCGCSDYYCSIYITCRGFLVYHEYYIMYTSRCYKEANNIHVHIWKALPADWFQFPRTLNCCFPCGHQSGLTSHSGAWLSLTDQRLFLAFIVIDLTCGFVLGPCMCHSLHEIAGFVCLPTATAQVTSGESFIAFGHTLLCHRNYSVPGIERQRVCVWLGAIIYHSNNTNKRKTFTKLTRLETNCCLSARVLRITSAASQTSTSFYNTNIFCDFSERFFENVVS